MSRTFAVGLGGAMPQPIAYGEISQYARDMGLASTPGELAECVALVRVQDAAYLHHATEMSKPKGAGHG